MSDALLALDPGIAHFVKALRSESVETFESCEGGDGHAYAEPTVRFYGDRSEGFRALAVAMQHGLHVQDLRRVWPIIDGEPTGPWWELTLTTTDQPTYFGASTAATTYSRAQCAQSGSPPVPETRL